MNHLESNDRAQAPILEVRDLVLELASESEIKEVVKALDLTISRGETFALVGESGCGKSLTALSLMRLLPDAIRIKAGSIGFESHDLNQTSEAQLRDIRGRHIGIIFQEPATSLNPIMRVGDQLLEVINRHTKLSGTGARTKAIDWLKRVGIPNSERRIDDYPFQFSGGQKQRVMIAMALAAEPGLLIADEPTTALDVTIQAQILQLLKDLQHEFGMAILLITHDLGVVAQMAHHVALMYQGEIVEHASASVFFSKVSHPYARHLFSVLPHVSKRGKPLGFGAWQDAQAELVTTVSQTYSTPSVDAPIVLDVNNLSVAFPQREGLLKRVKAWRPVVTELSLTLRAGHTLALVGESGCGKTTLGKAILRLLDKDVLITGEAIVEQGDLLRANSAQLLAMRRDIQIIFQDPFASLNPRIRVGDILEEGMMSLLPDLDSNARGRYIKQLLEQVALPQNSLDRYPHEFSGGQRQRIAIARALAVKPKVLICDEPTSALDVSVQAQILNLLNDLQQETGLAYLFITHNFSVVEYFSHEVAVMFNGKIIESGQTLDVLASPKEAYTQTLLASAPPPVWLGLN